MRSLVRVEFRVVKVKLVYCYLVVTTYSLKIIVLLKVMDGKCDASYEVEKELVLSSRFLFLFSFTLVLRITQAYFFAPLISDLDE